MKQPKILNCIEAYYFNYYRDNHYRGFKKTRNPLFVIAKELDFYKKYGDKKLKNWFNHFKADWFNYISNGKLDKFHDLTNIPTAEDFNEIFSFMQGEFTFDKENFKNSFNSFVSLLLVNNLYTRNKEYFKKVKTLENSLSKIKEPKEINSIYVKYSDDTSPYKIDDPEIIEYIIKKIDPPKHLEFKPNKSGHIKDFALRYTYYLAIHQCDNLFNGNKTEKSGSKTEKSFFTALFLSLAGKDILCNNYITYLRSESSEDYRREAHDILRRYAIPKCDPNCNL